MEDAEIKVSQVTQKDAEPLPIADTSQADHAAIRAIFGLDKPLNARATPVQAAPEKRKSPLINIAIALVVVAICAGAWVAYDRHLKAEEEALALAKHQHELDREEARRNRIEYADIAFLDSLPPLAVISMEGKPLYARTDDGAYTELRARESTWIRNLPIKEDTVLHFGFDAEGFRHLSRSVAYYDWFPSHKPGGNPLQKAFRKVVLVPDESPRIEACAQLPTQDGAAPCEWTVFREIAFRVRYAEAVKQAEVQESLQHQLLVQNFSMHPNLAQAAGVAPGADLRAPFPAAEAPDAVKMLVKNLNEKPFGLYGSLTIQTDTPNTRVFFMKEPLMVVKPSGAMAQVQVQPGQPYTFAVYGAGRPLDISQNMSLRLEAPNAPSYVTEITPLQWRCQVPGIEKLLSLIPPALPDELKSPDYRHYMCDYTLTVSVKFEDIKALENEKNTAQAPTKTDNAS